MKRKNIKYVHPKYSGDFVGILDLQTISHKNALLPDQQRQGGFLEGVLTFDAISAISRIHFVKIAFNSRTERVIGMTAGVPFSIANRVGFLHQYVSDVSAHFSYACFGQLCVLHRKRGIGIGSNLLRQLEYNARKNELKAVVFPLTHANVVGAEFLKNRGYTPLRAPLAADVVLYHKAF